MAWAVIRQESEKWCRSRGWPLISAVSHVNEARSGAYPPRAATASRTAPSSTPDPIRAPPGPTTVRFPGPCFPPITTKRTRGSAWACAEAPATSAGPAASTTLHCRITSVFMKIAAFASVAGPVTARYSTFARVASDADCIPAHTGADAGSASPAGPVSRHAANGRYCRCRAGGTYRDGVARDPPLTTASTATAASTEPVSIQSRREAGRHAHHGFRAGRFGYRPVRRFLAATRITLRDRPNAGGEGHAAGAEPMINTSTATCQRRHQRHQATPSRGHGNHRRAQLRWCRAPQRLPSRENG